MTVMNSRLRAERQRSRMDTVPIATSDKKNGSSSSSSESFSAVGLISRYEGTSLIENGTFEELQLCKLFADGSEEDAGGSFYPCEAKLCWTV